MPNEFSISKRNWFSCFEIIYNFVLNGKKSILYLFSGWTCSVFGVVYIAIVSNISILSRVIHEDHCSQFQSKKSISIKGIEISSLKEGVDIVIWLLNNNTIKKEEKQQNEKCSQNRSNQEFVHEHLSTLIQLELLYSLIDLNPDPLKFILCCARHNTYSQ